MVDGRSPAADGDPWAVAERRSRALEEPLDIRLERREPFPILDVRNPLHRTAYLVLLPAFPDRSVALCTCADFARRGLGTCKHIEAGGRWLERHPQSTPRTATPTPDPTTLWETLERCTQEARADDPDASRAWRRPGRILIDRAPPPWVEREEEREEGVRRGQGKRITPTSRGRP